jgi:hypothetical protein
MSKPSHHFVGRADMCDCPRHILGFPDLDRPQIAAEPAGENEHSGTAGCSARAAPSRPNPGTVGACALLSELHNVMFPRWDCVVSGLDPPVTAKISQ